MTLSCLIPCRMGRHQRACLLDSAVTQARCEPGLATSSPLPHLPTATLSTSLGLGFFSSRMGRIPEATSWVAVRIECDTAHEVLNTGPGSQQVLKTW